MLRKCRRRRWPRLHRRVSPGPRGTAPERILQRSGTPAARARVRAQLRQQGADEPPSPAASNAAQQPSCQLHGVEFDELENAGTTGTGTGIGTHPSEKN